MTWIRRRLIVASLSLFLGAIPAGAQVLYTNNNMPANTVSGFRIDPGGFLTEIPNSPFPTGGSGTSGITAQRRVLVIGDFLYAANTVSGTVSGFSIDASTGDLTALSGSPFPLGTGPSAIGMSLTATPDGKYLMVGHAATGVIAVFSVAQSGALTPSMGSLVPMPNNSQMAAMRVTPNGRFLIAAMFDGFVVFRIGVDGQLSPVPGAPTSGLSGLSSVDINCSSSRIFVSRDVASHDGRVDVFRIDQEGATSKLSGSPFRLGDVESRGLLLCPNGRFLFSTHPQAITTSVVMPDGSLQAVAGSPFPVTVEDFNNEVEGMAASADGSLLFVIVLPNLVATLGVSETGALTNVPGSPFMARDLRSPVSISSLAVYPAFVCRPRVTSVVRDGKRLFVAGENFELGSVIILDGEKQKTIADPQTPESLLIGKKAGKKVRPGGTVMIQVRWPNGTISEPIEFKRPL